MINEISIDYHNISNKIYTIRNEQVMLDRDLAEMYQVKSIRLREQVKRNHERFPENFMFQLTDNEVDYMVSQNAIPSRQHLGGHLPYVFTEQGVAMLSAVLKSSIAVQVSIHIINAFVRMRKLIGQEAIQQLRLSNIENKLLEHDQKFNDIFTVLERNELPQKGVFFEGQIYDAYELTSKIIRSAHKSIILIDNYIDESVISHLLKKKEGVIVQLLTKSNKRQLSLDIQKVNEQYGGFIIKTFSKSHDRFLIIDNNVMYHLGASLKDLGKKWFAFSKMDKEFIDMILQEL
ncbi:MAG: ORF6N domain-containing protein [Chitinophagales bacterium]|nr:ORF6N domain-containing protein [Chitinophagales bacterium]